MSHLTQARGFNAVVMMEGMGMLAWILLLVSALCGQDFTDLRIEKLAGNFRFTDGPVWSKEGFLLFSDVPNNRVVKWTPGIGLQTYRENSAGASGHAFDAQGRLISCETRNRRLVRKTKDGWEVLADRFEGKRLNAPNDVVVRRDGHIYFTDPAFGEQLDRRELDFFGVYHISPKGELEVIAKPKGRPNGVALSPNGRILYVSNSDERAVYAYDLDGAGRASQERLLLTGIDGPPAGIRTDEKGNLWVACNQLAVYSSQGKLLKTIELAETPRNCAFGDADFQTLYVTAMTSVYRVRLNVKGAIPY
ncbi:MAG: SMP-30/gluconolactonase/LRE family protein [Bryobacteraceae bacterium]|nr:SMP-30/gluconolactonase/LRE family protein [Bryobacteraceae bacterium]MDW8378927.1 SMP-30/gluconolactonase/LRE family protein [Bryobacterales bacterium]